MESDIERTAAANVLHTAVATFRVMKKRLQQTGRTSRGEEDRTMAQLKGIANARVRRVAAAIVLVTLVTALPTAAESPGGSTKKGHLHYTTTVRVKGQIVLARVTLAPWTAGREKAAGKNVLKQMGAEEVEEARYVPPGDDPIDPSVTWSLVGSPWTIPSPVTFSYNPGTEPITGLGVFETALAMWTDVPTSALAYASGGTTSACASLFAICGGRFDQKNVMAWGPVPPDALGVAMVNPGGESDILLNKDVEWIAGCDTTDGFSLLEVMLHELGHSSGLGHAADGAQIMSRAANWQCDLGDGDRAGVTYLYPQAHTKLTGTVQHDPSGIPLTDALVVARPIGGPVNNTATLSGVTATANASYGIELPAPLSYELTTWAPGYGGDLGATVDVDGSPAVVDLLVQGPPPVVVERPSTLTEGETAHLALTLPEPAADRVEVEYLIEQIQILENGWGSGGPTDAQSITGTATFEPGDVRVVLPDVVVPQDELYEPSDALRISMNDPVGPAGLSLRTASIPITNDDPITVSMLPASAREGDGSISFELRTGRPSESPIDVTVVEMIDGTATNGLDYADHIAAGIGTDGHGVVELPIFTDGMFEGPETFTLVVSAAGQQVEALGTIIDADDPDTDGDGIQDSGDPDDDNDGFSDEEENVAGSSTINPNSTPEVCDGIDNDLDGVPDDGSPDADGDLIDDDCEENGFTFEGFDAPVDNPPVLNIANAGRTIPVKFRLTNADGSPVSDPASVDSITSTKTSCSSADDGGTDALEAYSGDSGLQYKGDGVWQFNWATPKSFGTSGGPCRKLTLTLADGTTHTANFRFK